ncbi:PKD domain-containing protein [Oceanimonas marisflavi]|uniref:PKD domain-containing protein n=1 Tax=Oceanimonas marisflavi TaxID=2059724 RepID=UPI001300371E|nr:PKD domain-containing protein [Oceanimonas marisflavi]
MAVQEKYSEALMARDGIEGTGIGYDENGEVTIKVYTARAGMPDIPQAIEQIPVQVVVTGRFVARADPTARFARPVPIGVSSGHPDITAGTIGARVKDADGIVYALSNNHVYANSNEASIGDTVLQPGALDGGQNTADDTIGTLDDFEPIDFSGTNTMDAAIAASSVFDLGVATPGDGYGVPALTTVTAYPGQAVQKYGRTTGWTQGEVAEVNVTIDVCYRTQGPFRCVKSARFVEQIAISPGAFSDGGDSGSLIVTDDSNNNPVGLLFAGSNTRTLANQIDVVLNRFNVTIDDGSGDMPDNTPPTANFSYATSELTAHFTDQSTDSDGSITAWLWEFGDGNTSTEQNPGHTYGSAGPHTVQLTVTDNDGETDTMTQGVTVSEPVTGDITLAATGYKVRGLQKADLSWSGAAGDTVEVYRDNAPLTTTGNDGFYTDNINKKGGDSYRYKICNAGTTACSAEVTVTF